MSRQHTWGSRCGGRAPARDRYGNDWRAYAAKRKKLISSVRLSAAWAGKDCNHKNAVTVLDGLRAALGCPDCEAAMEFRLRFGRPATFEVFELDVGKGGAARHVGLVSGSTASGFIRGASARMFVSGVGDDGVPHTKRDDAMLSMMMEALFGAGPERPFPAADFVGAWRGAGCGHKSASCRVYGDTITIDCGDCGHALVFLHAENDSFDVSMGRPPGQPGQYGRHAAADVVGAVRELAGALAVPRRMADRMSADPERDASRTARLAECLVRHGLLRRAAADQNRPRGGLISKLSAASCDRTTFSRRASSMVASMRRRGLKGADSGERVSEWQMMESLRLEWPHAFEGEGIGVVGYDPAGMSQYCIRCGFSTLDDGGAGPDRWRRGCPKCGYGGHLLGLALDGGSA